MNPRTRTFMTMLVFASLLSCKKERSAEEIAAAEKHRTDSIEQVKADQLKARRLEAEKIAAEKNSHREKAMERRLKSGATYKDSKGNLIYLKADEMPTFSGGNDGLTNYIQQHVKYPEAAYNDSKEGTVFVDFVVGKDGKVYDVVATDSVNTDVDHAFIDEAVRVVSTMPEWTPAKQKGKPVAVAYSVPIKFQMD